MKSRSAGAVALALSALAGLSAAAGAAEFLPKYGPKGAPRAALLKDGLGHLRSKPAPDFWALVPYYEGMRGKHSASAASAATALNALKRDAVYSSSDELVSERALLNAAPASDWAERISGDAPAGVDLRRLGALLASRLAGLGLPDQGVKLIPISDSSPATVAKVRALLEGNEKSSKDVLIANCLQSAFTDDPEGAVGTYSAVGAFDAVRGRVLILETDRAYYEPYWVSLETFVLGLSGVKDPKTGLSSGGLLWLGPAPAAP